MSGFVGFLAMVSIGLAAVFPIGAVLLLRGLAIREARRHYRGVEAIAPRMAGLDRVVDRLSPGRG